MRKNGVEEPAFLTQAPNTRGAKNFYVASDRAPVIRKTARTGEATRKGTFDAHPETLRENAAKAQGLADATDGFTGFIHESGTVRARRSARSRTAPTLRRRRTHAGRHPRQPDRRDEATAPSG
jgi:hypothetical protein